MIIQHYRRYLAIAILFFLYACNGADTGTASQPAVVAHETNNEPLFERLLGTWKMDDGKSYEQWTRLATNHYQSQAFTVESTDTSWNEQASVYKEQDKWIFENTVKNQNGGKAVQFVSTMLDDHAVQFSNPAHDFPTDIHYTIIDPNTVQAYIVGPNAKGGRDTIHFNYKRFK